MKTFKSFINEASIAQDYVAPKDGDDEVKDIKPRSKGEDDFKKSHKMTHTKHPVAGDHQFDGSIKEIKEAISPGQVLGVAKAINNKVKGTIGQSDKGKYIVKANGKRVVVGPSQSGEKISVASKAFDRREKGDAVAHGVNQLKEEVELEEAPIKGNNVAWDDLQSIAKSKKSGRVKFNNNKMETVDAETAKQIVTTLNKLNPKNKEKAISTLSKDPAGLMKVLDIANKA